MKHIGYWPALYGVPSGPKFNFWILLVLLAFDIVVLQFVLTSAIQHSRFQFLYSNWRFDIVCFTIQHPSLRNSTSKFTIQHPSLRTIQHPSLRNSTFNFGKYPTAIQSMTVSVGSENYQNSPCVGASKGRSRYPRQYPRLSFAIARKKGDIYLLRFIALASIN